MNANQKNSKPGVTLTNEFARQLIQWQQCHGRQHLPWQHTGDAYKTWLSEVMLQQTQVATVLGYYARFLEVFPTVSDLAKAPEQTVMQLWQGLGYYSRARNLHACAQQVVERFSGQFPCSVEALETLPGIGRSTAGAIASLAYGKRAPILDGNVKRVLCRHEGIEGYPEQSAVKRQLWGLAESLLPAQNAGQYNQALMDLGATVCLPRNPACLLCPVKSSCVALKQGQTQLLPTPKPKKHKVKWYFLALMVQNNASGHANEWLVRRQLPGQLWQSLWMPPVRQLESDEGSLCVDQARQWLVDWSIRLDESVWLEQMQAQSWAVHELTHRQLHFKCLSLPRDSVSSLPDGFEFKTLQQVPVPKAFLKLIDHAQAL